MFLIHPLYICYPHQKGASATYNKQASERGERRRMERYEHRCLFSVHQVAGSAAEDWLAGSAGKLAKGLPHSVLCCKPAGRELGGWQAFRRVPVDIWCRERVGGEEGKRQPDFSELAASFFFTFAALPAPSVRSREAAHPLPKTMRCFYTIKTS